MNLANRVTLLRLVFAAVACVFLLMIQEDLGVGAWRHGAAWTALAFFIIATASDALDGYIARRDNAVTAFGRIADPFVDKVVVCGCLVFLVVIEETRAYFHPWMAVLVLVREFLVTGIRGYVESLGVDFGADQVGKVKMVVQSILVGFLIGVLAFREPPFWLGPMTHLLAWSTVLLTVWSGVRYVIRAAKHFGSAEI